MAEQRPNVWVDASSFDERWDIQGKPVGKGGQGTGYRATRRSDGKVAFIKEMDSDDSERRARGYIEACAYESLVGLDVPQLIESNAHQHGDKSVQLYIATEFVEGPTLRRWRDKTKKVSLTEAVDITLHLLGTVAQAHEAGILHRDIKPENIIMRGGDVAHPVLVDFGISFHRLNILSKALTSDGSQLGNRFLWLPEFSPGSRKKRCPTADLTMVSGIFLYLITGINPVLPRDGDGNLPHQRDRIRSRMSDAEKSGVLSFFDRAFQFETAARFQSVEEVKRALLKIRQRIANPGPVDDLPGLQETLNNPIFQSRGVVSAQLRMALGWAMDCYGTVKQTTSGNLLAQQVDLSGGVSPGHISVRWDLYGNYAACTHVWVEIVGSEFVWHTVKGEVFRAPTNSPLAEEAKAEFINRSVLPDIRRVLANDSSEFSVDFSGYFSLRDHFALSLGEAEQRAQAQQLPIYVLAYDESQTIKDIQFLCERVLGDARVQAIILTSFIVLVIGRSKLPSTINAPQNCDFRAIFHKGNWLHVHHLAANRGAAVMDFGALQQQFDAEP